MTIKARDLPTINDLSRMYSDLKQFEKEKPEFNVSWQIAGRAPVNMNFNHGVTGEGDMRMALLALKENIKRVLKEIFDVEID